MSAHAANPPASALPDAAAGSPGSKWGLIALLVGAVFIAASIVGLVMGIHTGDPRPFLGYLIGAAFWLSLMIGALILVMLSYLFDGGWMVILRRQLEHALGGFKWLALLFLPMLLAAWFAHSSDGVPWLWMDPTNVAAEGGTIVANDHLYEAKSAYLGLTAFSVRFVLYFAIWVGLAGALRRHSFAMDADGDARHWQMGYRLSAAGVLLTALALTLAAIDWFKSLEYHWFSTMYGVWFFAACIRAGTAALIVGAALAAVRGGLRGLYGGRHSYLLGCLLLAFTVFWAYISFSQYFLQYSANIPEETYWYNMREFSYVDGVPVKNSWWMVSMFLVFAHFLAPFIYLLFYRSKFGWRIVAVALWILVFHLLDLYWNILPQRLFEGDAASSVRQFGISLWDITTFIGFGGVCVWAYLGSAARHLPIPIRDPRILESVSDHA